MKLSESGMVAPLYFNGRKALVKALGDWFAYDETVQ